MSGIADEKQDSGIFAILAAINNTKTMKVRQLLIVIAALALCACDKHGTDPVIPDVSSDAVFSFFKEINAVPRPSLHEEKMREYLTSFAQARGLRCQDAGGNIIIYKDATAGMEQVPTVVLQTHMDMVCVAAEGYSIDFLTTGIEQETVGGYIQSKGNKTSLGADNGIGVAIVLAILDSKEVRHGPLECLFTWNEESGMSGAAALEPGILKGKYMLNIDSEEDGYLLVGTAGSVSVNAGWMYTPEAAPTGYAPFQLRVSGLAGGHSGVKINDGGANANKLIADFLAEERIAYRLVSFDGGSVANAITTQATSVVLVPIDEISNFTQDFDNFMAVAKARHQDVDLDMSCEAHNILGTISCIPDDAAACLIGGLSKSPQGVIEWSAVVEGIFELSNNIGIVATEEDNWYVREMPRGFNMPGLERVASDIAGAFPGAEITMTDRFAPWSPDINGSLITYARDVYDGMHTQPIGLFIVGGGVEASMFSVTYPDMQIICYGPTILDAHTIMERVEISTVENVWKYTLHLLGEMSKLK